jgi:hypothetical protein
MCTITNLESIRLGKFPYNIDVSAIKYYNEALSKEEYYSSEYGLVATASLFPDNDKESENFVQFRLHNEKHYCAIFTFRWLEQLDNLTDFWKNSTVIYDSRNQ